MKKVSIIIRTKNEERWIASCLKGVYSQDFKDFEVIIVDNKSTDYTLAKVKQYPVDKVVTCEKYLPGKALNLGIRESEGEFIVCLSGHCIPTNDKWLSNLLRNMEDPEVAGVYGRQEPLSFTPPADKRDLMIVFGPERRIQRKDTFFHNANSMIRRSLWERFPFDEEITNIEDRIWAKQVLDAGYVLVYEPEASVYHWHGIHQDGDEVRCRNVVRILEDLHGDLYRQEEGLLEDLNVVCIIPVKGRSRFLGDTTLLEYALATAKGSGYIDKIVVSTDDESTRELALRRGADEVVMRDESLSYDFIGLEKVYSFTLSELEKQGIFPDIAVLLEITYPFRPPDLVDKMIHKLVREGLDTVLPAKIENNPIWVEKEGEIKRVDEGLVPRQFKSPVYLSFKGLCCVTRPEFLRNEQIIGVKLGMYTVQDPYCVMEVRNEMDVDLPGAILNRIMVAQENARALT